VQTALEACFIAPESSYRTILAYRFPPWLRLFVTKTHVFSCRLAYFNNQTDFAGKKVARGQ